MKSTLSLTLIMCLVGSGLPLTAQEQTATVGPIARAVTLEAARFATVGQSQPGDAEWSRVRELEPGTEITVTVKGSRPGQLYFIAGDESQLTVLDVAHADIPAVAKRELVDTASDHPIYFVLAQQGRTFLLHKDVHLTPEGIFVGDRKVAELEQIVVQIARDSVAEISVWARRVGRATGLGAAIGGAVGLVTGLVIGTRYCGNRTCDTFPPIAFGLFYGMYSGGIGSGIGAVVGAARGKTRDVIYRAP